MSRVGEDTIGCRCHREERYPVGGTLLRHGQAFDAYAALRYLSGMENVDPARVAVLGQSLGGYAALYANDRDLAAQYFAERFRAAIAYYPSCRIPGANMVAPTLILKGEADEWSSVELCQAMVEHLRSNSAPITLIVYPGVHHAFDVALLHPGVRYFGHWLEMRRQQRMQKKRLAHSSTPILPAHLPASRRQSDPVGQPNGPTLLVDPMPSSKRETGVRVDPLGTV